MAREVARHKYLFHPKFPKSEYKKPKPVFTFNDLHDIESIWWIAVYVLLFNDDQNSINQDCANHQLMLARDHTRRQIFNRQMLNPYRSDFFQECFVPQRLRTVLLPSFLPQAPPGPPGGLCAGCGSLMHVQPFLTSCPLLLRSAIFPPP